MKKLFLSLGIAGIVVLISLLLNPSVRWNVVDDGLNQTAMMRVLAGHLLEGDAPLTLPVLWAITQRGMDGTDASRIGIAGPWDDSLIDAAYVCGYDCIKYLPDHALRGTRFATFIRDNPRDLDKFNEVFITASLVRIAVRAGLDDLSQLPQKYLTADIALYVLRRYRDNPSLQAVADQRVRTFVVSALLVSAFTPSVMREAIELAPDSLCDMPDNRVTWDMALRAVELDADVAPCVPAILLMRHAPSALLLRNRR